ncbi:lysolipid transporter protein spinster isoform X2 [Arctopsyche grandis]|uniref:lysolipid transporter protein spinster isoform X2 n=1 Tax=Arctopsyche grandis TaxID=121162 RepID=UPI00406D6A77
MSSGRGSPALRDSESGEALIGGSPTTVAPCAPRGSDRANKFTVAVLCFVNLINYMDRFTLAGILTDIQTYFDIGDDSGGLLQTVFILSYMVFAPIFGYLGDRYSRTKIMACGVFLWSITTLIGSFMTNFGGFIFFRAMVGIGEASYSTIAPTIISDLFVKDVRSKMLAFFYFAIPVGSGLGYIIGSETANAMGSWQWGLRVTPVLGIVAVFLILLVVNDPERGEAEGGSHAKPTSYKEDLRSLLKNPSFMLSTAGFTCVAFVAGALAWWGPRFIYLGMRLQNGGSNAVTLNDVSFNFGIITMMSGLIGVPLGVFIGEIAIKKFPQAHPIICGIGLLTSAPLLGLSLWLIENYSVSPFVLMFFGELALNLNWAIVADILLYVVIPTRRSTAEAFQILISHMFGDAGSPYLVGVISEALKMAAATLPTTHHIYDPVKNVTVIPSGESDLIQFKSLQYALFTTSFIEVLGGIFFLLTAIYVVNDKMKVEKFITENSESQPTHRFAHQIET